MKMPATLLAVLAATLLIARVGAQDKANPPRPEPVPGSAKMGAAKTVKELQKERLAVLQELTDQLTRLYQNARVDLRELLEARLQLLQAQLDAAEKPSERLALYKNIVDELRQYEKIAQAKVEAAQGTSADVLKIKARRLEAEIHLQEGMPKAVVGKRQKAVVASPRVEDVPVTQQYVGQIQAQRHIEIRAPQKGYVESILVKEGQGVKQGDVIFKLLPVLNQAKLNAALADVKLAEQELQNARKLFENKAVGTFEVALFETKLEKAQAGADLARAELHFAEVRAPFDGIVDRLHVQQGGLIKEGEAFTTLSDNSSMWVYFNVPEARYLKYLAGENTEKEGELELVLADGSKFQQRGKITAIGAEFNRDTGAIPFRADFPNPDRVLRHGMTGKVILHRTLNHALIIPQRATLRALDKRIVFVVDQADVAHRREIVVQNELDDSFIIDSGVDADDRIVVEGIEKVHDGEKVEYELHPSEQHPEGQ
jgi:membrane fusion protein (multidrug efflux system)